MGDLSLYADPVLRLRDNLGITTLVETGSYGGNSLVWAEPYFARLISIDISAENQSLARQRCPRAEFLVGDSRTVLPRVVRGLTDPTLFWLDAHNQDQMFGPGANDCPVLEELTAIEGFPHEHAVLIDDLALFARGTAGWPSLHDIADWAGRNGYEARAGMDCLILTKNK